MVYRTTPENTSVRAANIRLFCIIFVFFLEDTFYLFDDLGRTVEKIYYLRRRVRRRGGRDIENLGFPVAADDYKRYGRNGDTCPAASSEVCRNAFALILFVFLFVVIKAA